MITTATKGQFYVSYVNGGKILVVCTANGIDKGRFEGTVVASTDKLNPVGEYAENWSTKEFGEAKAVISSIVVKHFK